MHACAGLVGVLGRPCEVCVNTLDRMLDGTKRSDRNQVETAIDTFCETAQDKEAKLCYSLTVIKKDVSQVVAMGLPTEKICEVSNQTGAEMGSDPANVPKMRKSSVRGEALTEPMHRWIRANATAAPVQERRDCL